MSFLSGIANIAGDALGLGNIGGALSSLIGGPQSSANTGVSPQTTQAINSNMNNESTLASLLGNMLSSSALPLQSSVNNIYGNALGGLSGQGLLGNINQTSLQNPQIQSLLSQLTNQNITNPQVQSYLSGITSQQLPANLQSLIAQMNPQTQATQAQGNLSQQLQDSYQQAIEQTTGNYGGVNPGEGPQQSLAQSYLQNTAQGGANLQAQLAAMQAQAAQNQFGATLSGLNQQQGSQAQGLQSLLSALNQQQGGASNTLSQMLGLNQANVGNLGGLLSGSQGAANTNLSNPAQISQLLSLLGGQLGQSATGQANANSQYNQGLASFGTTLGNTLGTSGLFSNLFGGGTGNTTIPGLANTSALGNNSVFGTFGTGNFGG